MNKTAEEILKILEKNKGRAVSGEQIAKDLNLTRSAVWKHINNLKKKGYFIKSTNNRGYELSEETDIFSASGIYDLIKKDSGFSSKLDLKIDVVDEVTSTNTLLKEEARKGASEGRVLVAKKQTEGRGRLGRSFFSPKNGIYMSFILRPKISFRESLLLTTIAAVAVTEAIKEVSGKAVGIKWVNDVYLEGKKVCGILTEAEADVETGSLAYAVVGIGLNLTEPEGGVLEELKEIAGFLYGKEDAPIGLKSKLTAEIIKKYFYYYEKLPKHLFMEEYKKNQILIGKDIFVIEPDRKKKAKVLGVDDEARLMVEYEDGEKESLFTGEVSVREIGTEKMNEPKFLRVKKGLLFLILLFFALPLYGCGEKKPTNMAEPSLITDREEKRGYIFRANEEEFYIGEDIHEKLKGWNEPNSTYEAPSCARLGEDVIYTYSGFSMTANKKEDGSEILYSILLTDDSVMTAEGLYIGDTEERVFELYGKNMKKGGIYHYYKDNMKLSIVMKGETVVSIEYSSVE